MEENKVEDLAADQEESPSVDQASVDTPFVPEADIDWDNPDAFANDGLLDDALNANRGITPSTEKSVPEQPVVAKVQEQESEEPPAQQETKPEESTEEEIPEDNVEEEETEDSPPEDPNLIDVSELTDDDKFELEMHGKKVKWSWTEIQNQLKRSESASNESRKAKEGQEKYDQLSQELLEERKAIQSNVAANQMHPQLQQKLAEVQAAKAEEARLFDEQSMDYPFAKGKTEKLEEEFNKMTQDYNSYIQQQASFQRTQQIKALKDNGLGHLVTPGDSQDAYLGYIGNYSDNTQAIIRGNAELVKLSEMARKWEESQNKATKNTVPKKKSLKSPRSSNKGIPSAKKVENRNSGIDADAHAGNLDSDTSAFLDQYFASR